jgi:hypothetical protein
MAGVHYDMYRNSRKWKQIQCKASDLRVGDLFLADGLEEFRLVYVLREVRAFRYNKFEGGCINRKHTDYLIVTDDGGRILRGDAVIDSYTVYVPRVKP